MLKTFLENRVCEFVKSTDVAWFYRDTKHNPADLSTRPKNFENFQENLFWWTDANFFKKTIMNKKDNLINGKSEEILLHVLITKNTYERQKV